MLAPRSCFLGRERKDGKRQPEVGLQGEARSGAEFGSFSWSILLPGPYYWGGGDRKRKECVDILNYILEAELLGKVHRGRLVYASWPHFFLTLMVLRTDGLKGGLSLPS